MAVVNGLLSAFFGLAMFAGAVDANKLMVILMDGFRWDYFDIHGDGLRGFPRMFRAGTKAEHTVVDFPTDSYPNYYTIMTGLYDESHGMVSNFMYDSHEDEYFDIGTNPEYIHSHWWDGGDPLWITATRQGKSAYMYYWPNCQVTIRGLRPKYCAPYERLNTMGEFRAAVSDGISAFANGDADLVGIYFELADNKGHRHGPRSMEVNNVIRDVDEEIYQLFEQLEQRHLEDVDVIIVSDHGQTEISSDRTMYIGDFIDINDVERFIEGGALLGIWPKEGKMDKVYNALKNVNQHMSVYKKSETPPHWHYRKSDRIPPIMISAELGWLIFMPNQAYYNDSSDVYLATHGYDNLEPDMWGIFVASGPSFKSSFVSKPFNSVDIYQIMCDILHIRPSPHNGTWAHVSEMLYMSSTTTQTFSKWWTSCFLLLVFSFLK